MTKPGAGRRNKYGARKTHCHAGHIHASKREASRCNELHLLQLAGEIECLEREPNYYFTINGVQIKHENGRRAGYRPDFRYIDRLSGKTIVEDAKGYSARDWPLRKALFRALHPDIVLKEV